MEGERPRPGPGAKGLLRLGQRVLRLGQRRLEAREPPHCGPRAHRHPGHGRVCDLFDGADLARGQAALPGQGVHGRLGHRRAGIRRGQGRDRGVAPHSLAPCHRAGLARERERAATRLRARPPARHLLAALPLGPHRIARGLPRAMGRERALARAEPRAQHARGRRRLARHRLARRHGALLARRASHSRASGAQSRREPCAAAKHPPDLFRVQHPRGYAQRLACHERELCL
mmetsp:Transcript_21353/g.60870  ORF Transcript_21353/g.60870 Transcript_21353/m.60870 type:complete len:231 (-) Transcript_21353:3075-3767(-)